jgi:glutathione S-transferase
MLKLYNADICPFAHRARLVVTAKGIEHERIAIDLREMPQWYRELSPNQSVPFLQHDEKGVPESLIIMQYLDEAFGGLKLTPEDPFLRAKMRLAFDVIGSSWSAPFRRLSRIRTSPCPRTKSSGLRWKPRWTRMDLSGWARS